MHYLIEELENNQRNVSLVNDMNDALATINKENKYQITYENVDTFNTEGMFIVVNTPVIYEVCIASSYAYFSYFNTKTILKKWFLADHVSSLPKKQIKKKKSFNNWLDYYVDFPIPKCKLEYIYDECGTTRLYGSKNSKAVNLLKKLDIDIRLKLDISTKLQYKFDFNPDDVKKIKKLFKAISEEYKKTLNTKYEEYSLNYFYVLDKLCDKIGCNGFTYNSTLFKNERFETWCNICKNVGWDIPKIKYVPSKVRINMFNTFVDTKQKDQNIANQIKTLFIEIQEAHDQVLSFNKNGLPLTYIYNKLLEKVTNEISIKHSSFDEYWNQICDKIGWFKIPYKLINHFNEWFDKINTISDKDTELIKKELVSFENIEKHNISIILHKLDLGKYYDSEYNIIYKIQSKLPNINDDDVKKIKKMFIEIQELYEKNTTNPSRFLSYKFVLAKLLEKIGTNIICTKETSFNTHIWSKMSY